MADNVGPNPDGTQLTHLTTGAAVLPADLYDLYDYPAQQAGPSRHPAPGSTWVRANMIASLDGAATVTGRSGGLGADTDRAVFAAMRANADVILVGARTAQVEGYHGAHLSVTARRRRQDRGQPEVPTIAVVTGSGAVDPDTPLFTESEVAPIVVTTAPGAAVAAARVPHAQVIVAASGPGSVDMPTALAELARRGLTRVLCEGGPSLLGTLLTARLIDELCLTIAPVTTSGSGGRIAVSAGEAVTSWRRVLLLGDSDGYLFTRQVRADRAASHANASS